MNVTLLSIALLAAPAVPASAEEAWLLAPLVADRAEMLKLFGDSGGLGVIQVAGRGDAGAAVSLTPRYAGFDTQLDLPPSEAEPDDLRDSLGAVGPDPSPWAREKSRVAPRGGPAGWIIVTRRGGREVRPLATREEVARWAAVAEAQRRAYEGLLRERRSEDLGLLGAPEKPRPERRRPWRR